MATKWPPWLLTLPMLVIQTEAALSIGAFADNHMSDRIGYLRSSIFVETAFLEERPADISCSSLDGPSCLNAMLTEGHVLDGPGVIPDRLLHDLGRGPGDFITPAYWPLESLLNDSKKHPINEAAPLLTGEEAKKYLASGRNNTSTGILHFAGALLDRKLPLTFSNGLPNDVVATWDGRWIARDCSFAGKPARLPAPEGDLALIPSSRFVGPGQLSVSVELAGSLGYLRFSHPVSVRSLFVHWSVDPNAPRALVAGRLGLESVWSSHLDPKQLDFAKGWIDVSGDPLAQVDELVFMAAKGLQIGAIQIATVDGVEDQERTVLLLRPVSRDGYEENEEMIPQFVPLLQKLGADATPFVASIQEVVDHNLRLRISAPPKALGGPRGEHVPGLLSRRTVHEENKEKLTEESLKFRLAANQNAEFFAHGFLTDMAVDARDMLAGFTRVPAGVLPEDLRRQLSMEAPDLAQTIQQHVRAGGWKRSTPLRLPNAGSDEAVQKYMTAKRQQISFDLVSAALMYITHNSGF